MTQKDHAIVIGGSIAGLFAARVLSDHFNKVTIIERDVLTDEVKPRDGVPQSRHVHQLLVGGLDVMRELFPSIDDDLLAFGAKPLHAGYNLIAATRFGFMPPVETGMHTFACTRPGLEYVIRKQINQIKNINIMGGYRVTDLIASDDRRVVQGVQVEQKLSHEIEEHFADLIVDASGRSSNATDWLTKMGYQSPDVTHVNAHVGYATCWFEKPDYIPDNIVGLLSLGDADNPRTCLIIEAEHDKWLALLASKNADYPPTDVEGFLEFAKSCPSPLTYNYLKHAKPLGSPYGYRRTENHWRHYEDLPSRPENFIITGDAACAFNPIYGHGMSVAAFDAKLMGEVLANYSSGDLTGFADEFQKKLGKQVAVVFSLASADDMEQPSVEGTFAEQPWLLKQMGLYFRQALRTMYVDDVVRTRFNQVSQLTEPPTALVAPNIIWRVLRFTLLNNFAPHLLPKLPQDGVLGVTLEPELSASVHQPVATGD